MILDDDEERGRLNSKKRKRMRLLVNPLMLKVILTVAPWVAKILRLGMELVKLFKE